MNRRRFVSSLAVAGAAVATQSSRLLAADTHLAQGLTAASEVMLLRALRSRARGEKL